MASDDSRRPTAVRPGAVPHAAGAQRPHRLGGALLLAVQLAVHRRSDDRHGQAHRRRLRLALAVRQRPRRHAHPRAGAVGHLRAQDAGHRLPAAGRGQRHHPDDGDLQVGARRGQRPGRADLRQPRRELRHLRRRPARTGGQVPRPADGRALAGIRAGPAECGRARRARRSVHRPRHVHLRAGAVHGGRRRGDEERRGRRPTASTSRCSSRWSRTRSPRW